MHIFVSIYYKFIPL